MNPDSFKRLETRIYSYSGVLPELVALLLYRQLHRARGLTMEDIDERIIRIAKGITEDKQLPETCSCSGKHATGIPFSHWIAGD